MSISRRLKLPAIAVSAVLLSAVLAEGAFRLAGVRATNLTEGVYETFQDGSFRLRDNADAYLAWYPKGFHVYTNEAAVRVAKGDPGWTRGPVDVVIAGDSQALGWGLDYEKTFAGIFDAQCREAGVSIANISVGDHGLANQQEVLAWLRERREMSAKQVVLCMGPSQVSTSGRYAKRHVWGGGLYSAPPSAIIKAKIWLACRFASYSVVRNAWKNLRGREEVRFLDIFENSRAEERRTRLRGALKEFKEECARSGANLVIVYLPVSYTEDVDQVDPERLDGQLPARLCREVAEELGVPFLDFSPVLRELLDRGLPVALKGDPHYSLEMNVACAKVLWNGLDWAGLNRRKQ